ncbi:enniatin synthase [Fusarium mexicanum]|uniref:Enniatin synthase n=1 Tax=Fusarium mexicanum TaxID=751941 RepID=A0A8H5IEG3_9HYPO|nr:enniatin synthase [Fusarium mexicanum]
MLAVFSSSPETTPDATNTSGELTIVPISPSVESKLAEHLPQYMIPVVQFIVNASIVDVFRQQVSSTPEHLAVKDSSYELTYSQLDQQSDLIARWLCKKSFSAEAIISVIAHRSCYTVIAFLAILKADLAYLPLDPSTPRERIHAILLTTSDLQMILLGTGAEPSSLPAYYDQFFSISNILQNECGTQLSDDQGVGINLPSPRPNSLAYVIFTSGSTGRPKGVLVEHRGIVRMVKGSNVTDPLPQNPIMAHTISISFDAAQWEIYATLLNGGTLICLDNMDLLDQQAFNRIVTDDKIQVASFTPALLRRYLKESPEAISSLHTTYVGGEKAYVEDLLSLRSIIKGAILNVYGPTENSVTSTMYKLTETDMCTNGVAIGRAISNSGAFVVDHQSCLVPLGVVGELVVTGDGLARGYVDPSQNSDKFITIMVGGKETRAYRTGDYVRYRPVDGQLEFLGRMDGQVKIRGYRIELGEIEHVLQSHESVTDAVAVIHRQIDQELSIACFITVSRDDGDLSSAEKSKLQKDLYQKLRMQLPS